MRALLLIAILAPGPVVAQDLRALNMAADAQAADQADAARRREVELTNQLSVLNARLASERALSASQAGGLSPRLPVLDPKAPPASAPTYVQIPDAALAASNARIRAASENRR